MRPPGLLLLLLAGCATASVTRSAEEARRSLLAAHATERETHLARDPDRIAALAVEGFVVLDKGEIRTLSVAESAPTSPSTSQP